MLSEMLLQGIGGGQADKVLFEQIQEAQAPSPDQRVHPRQDSDQPVDRKRKHLEVAELDNVGGDTDLDEPLCHRAHDGVARALLDIHIDPRVAQQKGAQGSRKELAQCRGVGLQADVPLQASGKFGQLALHVLELPEDEPGVMGQRTTRRCQTDTAPSTLEQLDAGELFHFPHAGTCGGERNVGLGRTVRNARGFSDAEKKLQVGEFEAHTRQSASVADEGTLPDCQIVSSARVRHVRDMPATGEILGVTLCFILAGAVKGITGMGLPTVAMGLLGLFMPPAQAAAFLIIPSAVTNVWQFLAGPRRLAQLQRLWPMLLPICVTTWAAAGFIAGNPTRYARMALGAALIAYAGVGLAKIQLSVPPQREKWLGALIGATTGLVTGATGVFVIPAVPYVQALGLEKDDLVQALGLSFTVSTFALAAGLASHGAFHVAAAGASTLCTLPALVGMLLGQAVRAQTNPATFRVVFFVGLLVLGLDCVL